MSYTIDKKIIEILTMLIHQQNRQLAQIIAEEENMPLHLVNMYVPSTHKIKQLLGSYASSSEVALSTSLASPASSSSLVE